MTINQQLQRCVDCVDSARETMRQSYRPGPVRHQAAIEHLALGLEALADAVAQLAEQTPRGARAAAVAAAASAPPEPEPE